MRTQPQDIIKQLQADNSRLAKEAVLEAAMTEGLDEFFEGLKMCYDTLYTFGVKQVPVKQPAQDPQGLGWDTFKQLADKLYRRELTGNVAKRAIELCMDLATEEQWNLFYAPILRKDLRCGISEVTINKVAEECGVAYRHDFNGQHVCHSQCAQPLFRHSLESPRQSV